MSRLKPIFLVLMAIALMAPMAHAQDHQHGDPAKPQSQGVEMQKPMGMGINMHGGLRPQLSAEEQALLEKLVAAHHQKTEPLQKQLRARHAMLEALLLEDKIDDKKIDGLVKDINEIQAKLFGERISLKKQLIKNDLPMGGGMMMGKMGAMHGGLMGSGMKCPMMPKQSMDNDQN